MARHAPHVAFDGNGFLGYGPPHVCAGDVVVLPESSDVPMMERPARNSAWRFVSFGYVEGVMEKGLDGVEEAMMLEKRRFVLV